MQYYEASPAPLPVPASMHLPPHKGLAIASLIVGVGSLVLCWIPFIGILGGAVAMILGITALVKAQSRGLSITGVVAGVVAFIAGIALTMMAFTLFSAFVMGIEAPGPIAQSVPVPEETQQDQG